MQLEEFSEELYKANNKIQELKNGDSSIEINPGFLSAFQGLKNINFNELKSKIRTYLIKLDSKKSDQIFELLINDINQFASFFEKNKEILTTYKIDKVEHNPFYNPAKIATHNSSKIWTELKTISSSIDSIYFSPGISNHEINNKIDQLRIKEIRLQKEYDIAKMEAKEINSLSEKRNKELTDYNIPFQKINDELIEIKSELSVLLTPKNELVNSESLLSMHTCGAFYEYFRVPINESFSEETFFNFINMKLKNQKFTIKDDFKGHVHFLVKHLQKFIVRERRKTWRTFLYSHLNNIEENTSLGKSDDYLISQKHKTFKEQVLNTKKFLSKQ